MTTREKDFVCGRGGTAKLSHCLYSTFHIRLYTLSPALREPSEQSADSPLKEGRLRYASGEKSDLAVERSGRLPSYRSAGATDTIYYLPLLHSNSTSKGSSELE